MKLIFAVVQNEDSRSVAAALAKAEVGVTRLASTGGFLMSGSTTFLICAEEKKVDEVIGLIAEKSHRRKQAVPTVSTYGIGTYASVPVEVTVGGATIFVTDVERFEKV